MYGQMGKWMGAISDINHADKMNKKPPLFKKLFNGASIEQEAMEILQPRKGRGDGNRNLGISSICPYGPKCME